VTDGKMTDGESKKEGDRESYVLHISESYSIVTYTDELCASYRWVLYSILDELMLHITMLLQLYFD